MCNSKMKSAHAEVTKIDGRPVLQPAGNHVVVVALDANCNRLLKKSLNRSLSSPVTVTITRGASNFPGGTDPSLKTSPTAKKMMTAPFSPKPKPVKRGNDPNSLNSSSEKPLITPVPVKAAAPMVKKKSKCSAGNKGVVTLLTHSLSFNGSSASYESLLIDRAPGSIAAAQREQASLVQAQRKMRIAHYGRTPEKLENISPPPPPVIEVSVDEEKKCSFITMNSDPLYVAYHDEEWGVPVHDDKMLFELLVLSGAQVGLDWSTILKKRNDFRSAFAGFDAQLVAKFTERQIESISSEYGMDLAKIRGVVDNSHRILEVRKEFGSLDKYVWVFVNHKPISTNYKSSRKIPVKSSKSETISKDMVRRGFRFVGPTVMYSFMQAAGLTNDHLVACPRHHYCSTLH